MALFDILTWVVFVMVVGGAVGMGATKFVSFLLHKKDKRDVLKVLKGKLPNTLKLDGETIEVNKFIYKKSDGEIVRESWKDIDKKVRIQALKP